METRSKGQGYYLRSTSTSNSNLKFLKSPAKIRKRTDKDKYKDSLNECKTRCANLALQMYNSDVQANFKLVKSGSTGAAFLPPIGLVRHVDFMAKDQDNPHAHLNTFFAEVIGIRDYHVRVCRCLGPTASQPKFSDNHGCKMCWPGLVHHPADGNFHGKCS